MADFTDTELLDAIISRRSGYAHQPPRTAFNSGSGVPRPKELDSPDKAIVKDARHTYVTAMTDRCPMEKLTPEERAEVRQCTRDVLETDGYFVS
jgi:hypothetical protein